MLMMVLGSSAGSTTVRRTTRSHAVNPSLVCYWPPIVGTRTRQIEEEQRYLSGAGALSTIWSPRRLRCPSHSQRLTHLASGENANQKHTNLQKTIHCLHRAG